MNFDNDIGYNKSTKRKKELFFLVLFLLVFSFILNILIGPAELTPKTILSILVSPNSFSDYERVIVWQFRVPIALMAILVGLALGIAGGEMQTILYNPLAEPYTLGISAAAGFGAALSIVFLQSIILIPIMYLTPVIAFFFCILTSFCLYIVGKKRHGSSATIVLFGIAMLFLFSSLIGLIQFYATPEQTQTIVFWLFGSLEKSTWTTVTILSCVILCCVPFFYQNIWKLTSLKLGDDIARSLGINVSKLRLYTLIIISILTASAVSFVGTIGFIGLISPHISRILIGEEQRYFAPFSAVIGAIILSFASIGSKLIIPSLVFPIGIVTSIVGIPFFIWIILGNRREFW